MHRYAVARERADWKGWARYAAIDAANRSRLPRGELPWAMAEVRITHHYRVRRNRDLDNLTAGLKGILDGMTGILYRDDRSLSEGGEVGIRLVVEDPIIGSRDGLSIVVAPLRWETGRPAEADAEAVA